MLTKKPVKYALQYPDRVYYTSTLAEAKKMAKHRAGGRIYKVKHTRL